VRLSLCISYTLHPEFPTRKTITRFRTYTAYLLFDVSPSLNKFCRRIKDVINNITSENVGGPEMVFGQSHWIEIFLGVCLRIISDHQEPTVQSLLYYRH